MNPYVIFALVGLILIFFEFFVPGGLLAVLGFGSLLASLILLITSGASKIFIINYSIALVLISLMTIRLAIYFLKRKTKKGSIYLDEDQEGFIASSFNKDIIGKVGFASTDLKPSGFISIEDEDFQATSSGEYLEKGQKIRVINGKQSTLVVKKVK